jgi:hypothetical protein
MAMSTVLLGTEITRLRAPLSGGGYGNQEPDWTNATQAEFLVHWSHRAVSEVVGDEPRTVTRVKILGGAGLDLESTDRVVGPDGATYEVDGEVMRSYPRGQLHHVRAFLRRITTSD